MSDRTDYDAAVIGAGLAGLSCAAHLSRAGKRVVLLEQHSRPGGLWSSFSRRGFIFDISTHWVADPLALNRTLDNLGAPTVDFVQLDSLGRYLGPPVPGKRAARTGGAATFGVSAAIPAWDIRVDSDIEAFKQSARASFPSVSEKSLALLARTAVKTSRLVDSLPVYSAELASPLFRVRAASLAASRLRRLAGLARTPAHEYLEGLFPGGEMAGLRAALHSLAPAPSISALGLLVMLGTGLRGRLYALRDGAQKLSDAFAQAATRNGAEIRYFTRVTSILTDDHRVQGVILDDRTEIRAAAVVAAMDAKQTFYRLLHRDRIPKPYCTLLDSTPVSRPYALISAVTTLEPAALGFDGSTVFVCPSTDVPRIFSSADPAECPFLLVFPQHAVPDADRSLRPLQIVVPSSYAWHHHWDTRPTPERGPEYRALKEEWSRTIIERVQEFLPRLSSHLEAAEVATPITMYRYTLNTEGAVGWDCTSRRRWKQRVPFLRGLYQAGHWVRPPGALPVTRSGKWAAELVLRDLN